MPLLVGTWKDARWAIRFYGNHGFSLVTLVEKNDELLKNDWSVARRQAKESVLLDMLLAADMTEECCRVV